MNISDAPILGLAGMSIVPLLAQIPTEQASPMQLGEYGIVGVTVALALWSLREQSNRRLDDAKDYASDIKALQEARIQESRQHHEAQMTLLVRLLERGERKGD